MEMSKKEKLIKRLKSNPKDFSINEADTLMKMLGYSKSDKGRTSGSRIMYTKGNSVIIMHRPHPGNILKSYQVRQIREHLEKEELI